MTESCHPIVCFLGEYPERERPVQRRSFFWKLFHLLLDDRPTAEYDSIK